MQRTANIGYSIETGRLVVRGRGRPDDRIGDESVRLQHGRERQKSLHFRPSKHSRLTSLFLRDRLTLPVFYHCVK